MSFYQPSLSLYDILSALSNETAQRAREREGHDESRSRPHPAAAAAAGTPPGPGGRHYPTPGPQPWAGPQSGSSRSQRTRHYHPRPPYARPGFPPRGGASFTFNNGDPFSSFPGFFTPSTANGYFYNVPGQGYYYSPAHYWEDDDEDEVGEGESTEEQGSGVEPQQEQDEDMGTEPLETKASKPKEKAEAQPQPQPSYYHSDRRSARSSAPTYTDPFTELLSTLLGGFPSSYGQGEEDETPRSAEEDKQSKEKVPAEGEQEEGIEKPEKSANETAPESETKIGEGKEEEKEEGEGEVEEKTQHPATTVPPEVSPSPSPSPIPEPLQISKPETRLDLPFSPEVNVYDQPDRYVVVLALPGANSKAFKIDYHPSSHELLIKGNVIDRLGIDEKYLKFTEIKYGAFERTIKFPVLPRIKDEEIKATYSNGLLQIRVPKLELKEKPAPKKRITIEDVPDEELEFEENPNPVVE